MTQVSKKSGMLVTDEPVYQSEVSTDGTMFANSDDLVPTQKAVKTYTDSLVVGLWDDRGNFDASVNAYPSSGGSGTAGAILKGDIWTVSVAGTLPTGVVVILGDFVRALVDSPGNTQANWAVGQTVLTSNLYKSSFGIGVDGGGAVITTGSKGFTVIPYAGTITGWYVVGDQSGSVQFDLKVSGSSIIGAGNKPLLSSSQRNNAAVTGWTSTTVSANDEIEFVVDSAATVTRVNLIVLITKSQ